MVSEQMRQNKISKENEKKPVMEELNMEDGCGTKRMNIEQGALLIRSASYRSCVSLCASISWSSLVCNVRNSYSIDALSFTVEL